MPGAYQYVEIKKFCKTPFRGFKTRAKKMSIISKVLIAMVLATSCFVGLDLFF